MSNKGFKSGWRQTPAPPPSLNRVKRDYSKFNQQLFVNDISSVDWTTILPQRKDVDDIFEAFYSKLNRIVICRNRIKFYVCNIACNTLIQRADTPQGGYFGVKRIGMSIGNPRKLL